MKNRAGFTLLELMVVIAVIAVLSGISVPAMNSLKERHGFSGALQDVLLTLRQARLVAVEENETVVVTVDVAAGTYQAFVDDGAGSAIGPNGLPVNAKNGTHEDGERYVMMGSVPEGVRITGADFDGSTKFCYNNRGFPTPTNDPGVLPPSTITLASDQGGNKTVRLFPSGHSVIDSVGG